MAAVGTYLTGSRLSDLRVEWDQLMTTKDAEHLKIIFREPTVQFQSEGKQMAVGEIARNCLNFLNLGANPDEFNAGSMDCDLVTLKYEQESKLPARQKMWTWMLKSLHGPGSQPNSFFYLTKQCVINDVQHLFSKLSQILDRVTICSLEEEVHKVTHMEFNPSKQDLLAYVTDLRRAIRRLDDVNDKLSDGSKIKFSDAYVKIKLLRAVRSLDMYRTILDQIVALEAKEWEKLSSHDLSSNLTTARWPHSV